jgi:spore germination cell wall hydrolase CwlJ-like protein
MEAHNYDKDDLNNAILCVRKQARGDGHAAMNAVAHVIFNRIGAAGFAKTLHEVIYRKNQFSSMSICTDFEYNLGAPSVTDRVYASYVAATKIVKAVAERTDSDPTNGVPYYADLKESRGGWFVRRRCERSVNHPKRATVGHQVFYA